MDTILALINYLQIILIDGDYLNDYATRLPAWLQPIIIQLGIILESIIKR
jgi:hypothetical protein